MKVSWQAQGIVRLRGVAEVTFPGRHSIVRVGGVGVQIFVAGAGNREVRVVVEMNVAVKCERVLLEGWNRETAWQGCLMCGLPA